MILCECGCKMINICADEYMELYVCPECSLYALLNIEISENITFLREVE